MEFIFEVIAFYRTYANIFNLLSDRLSLLLAKDRSHSQTYIGCMKKGPVFTDPKLKWLALFDWIYFITNFFVWSCLGLIFSIGYFSTSHYFIQGRENILLINCTFVGMRLIYKTSVLYLMTLFASVRSINWKYYLVLEFKN